MFKDLPEGQTHSENDGCGEKEHNKDMKKSKCCGASVSGGIVYYLCDRCGEECSLAAEEKKEKIEKLAYDEDTIAMVQDLQAKVNEIIDYINGK